MENAVKAMYIAAGVLLGVMILSLGVALFANLRNYVETTKEESRFNEQRSFNAQFTKYINYIEDNDGDPSNNEQFTLTIQDVITAAGLAYEINSSFNPDPTTWVYAPNSLYVHVALCDIGEHYTEQCLEQIINNDRKMEELLLKYLDKKIRCTADDIVYTNADGKIPTGRVTNIKFDVNY